MTKWFWVFLLPLALAVGTLTATTQDARSLAVKGHTTFVEVLGGDEARLPEAIKYMEDARNLNPADTTNLYNLGRAYFYDSVTKGNVESAGKAERTIASLLELKPDDTRALSFHGSVLTAISGGKDIAMFMKGAGEMKTAVEKAPKNINNRIVIALTSENFPPQALAAMGNYDNLKDLEIVRDAFNGQTFYYAPHADVVMKAMVGDAYRKKGDMSKARENFEAALTVPKPAKAGDKAGREIIDAAIRGRMNGGEKALLSGPLSGCHSCHLNAPEKLLR
jgi:tetratricopeptide (TPR) repeat protein